MKGTNWIVQVAQISDIDRWFSLVKSVEHDFHDVDLANDQNHRSIIIKNIIRGTAIYIENEDLIVGAMIYSPNQNHIGWIAVHPDYRRQGIGTALVGYMFKALDQAERFKVKTFTEGDTSGSAARPFYQSLGFVPDEVLYHEEGLTHPVQLFIKENCQNLNITGGIK